MANGVVCLTWFGSTTTNLTQLMLPTNTTPILRQLASRRGSAFTALLINR